MNAFVALLAAVALVALVGAVVSSRRLAAQRGELVRLERLVARNEADAREANSHVGQLQTALDTIPQGVCLTDDRGEIVFRNQAARDFEASGHTFALVAVEVAEMIKLALEGDADTRSLDLFGPPRRSLVITTWPIPSAASLGALVIIDDASERRRLEAVRRDFVANISHELKTPVGALGLLAETLASEDDPEITRRLAGRIQTEAFRVDRTIEDLLELSRIESGETANNELVSVSLLVKEAVDRISPAADQGAITIEVHEPATPCELLCDRRQVVSAIYNLLDNAVKYSDGGGVVEVSSSGGRAGQVVIEVRDHGIGIPALDLERVFERFYRVDQGRSRETGGTGLGLAIVRHVLNNHAGEVEVMSRLGEGSTFRLSFPRQISSPDPKPHPTSPTPTAPGLPRAPTPVVGRGR